MAISITNDSKNNVSITNENKQTAMTWADADWKWKDASGTWAQPEEVLSKDNKNNITITNESKK
jgi:hypothetical protein